MQIVFQDPVRLAQSAHAGGEHRRRGPRDPPHRHAARSGASACARCSTLVGPAGRCRRALPARVQRRPAPAHRHRAGARGRAALHRRRRGGVGARRVHPGADPEPAPGPEAAPRAHAALHLARPARGRAPERPRGDHVPREASSRSGRATRSTAIRAIPTRARCSRRCRCRTRAAAARARRRRRRPEPAVAAVGMRVPPALSARRGGVPPRHAAARAGPQRPSGGVSRVSRGSELTRRLARGAGVPRTGPARAVATHLQAGRTPL